VERHHRTGYLTNPEDGLPCPPVFSGSDNSHKLLKVFSLLRFAVILLKTVVFIVFHPLTPPAGNKFPLIEGGRGHRAGGKKQLLIPFTAIRYNQKFLNPENPLWEKLIFFNKTLKTMDIRKEKLQLIEKLTNLEDIEIIG